MAQKMEIECGTWNPQKFEIDLDGYALLRPDVLRSVSPEEQKEAYALLHVTLDDVTFADDGCRNEDAVNSLIAVHVLGYDAEEWMESFLADMESRPELFHSCDIGRFEEHVERVLPYLEKWGPEGHEADALGYAITD